MIRKMIAADRQAFLDRMTTFYNSDAVLHSIPLSTMTRCFDACIAEGPYLEGYMLEHNGQTAGFALVSKSYSTEVGGLCIQIEDLFIDAAFRGLGLGRKLFDYLCRTYAGEAQRIRLEVEPGNRGARRLYERLGFRELPYLQMVKDRQ